MVLTVALTPEKRDEASMIKETVSVAEMSALAEPTEHSRPEEDEKLYEAGDEVEEKRRPWCFTMISVIMFAVKIFHCWDPVWTLDVKH